MYGNQRVLTCDECGVTGPDVQPVTVDGQRRTLCRAHNHALLAGEPVDYLTTLAADCLDLCRLQTVKRNADTWTTSLDELAADLRTDPPVAAIALQLVRERDTPFRITREGETLTICHGGGADV
jgi:hypothetical protein